MIITTTLEWDHVGGEAVIADVADLLGCLSFVCDGKSTASKQVH